MEIIFVLFRPVVQNLSSVFFFIFIIFYTFCYSCYRVQLFPSKFIYQKKKEKDGKYFFRLFLALKFCVCAFIFVLSSNIFLARIFNIMSDPFFSSQLLLSLLLPFSPFYNAHCSFFRNFDLLCTIFCILFGMDTHFYIFRHDKKKEAKSKENWRKATKNRVTNIVLPV